MSIEIWLLIVVVLLVLSLLIFSFVKLYTWITKPNPSRQSFDNEVVVIVGASSGIGECMAYEMAKERARLVLAGRRSHLLSDVAESCIRQGARVAIPVQTDVTSHESCENLIRTTMNECGHIDVLILAAAKTQFQVIDEMTNPMEFARESMDTNVLGLMDVTLLAAPVLRQRKGAICVLSSGSGKFGVPIMSIYSASKHALMGFFDAWSYEIGDDIQITRCVLGTVSSQMLIDNVGEKVKSMSMTPDTCAKMCVHALRSGFSEYYTDGNVRVLSAMRNLFPWLFHWCMRRFIAATIIKSMTKNA